MDALSAVYGDDCNVLDDRTVRVSLHSRGKVFKLTLHRSSPSSFPSLTLTPWNKAAEAIILGKLESSWDSVPEDGLLFWVCDAAQRALDDMLVDQEEAAASHNGGGDDFSDVALFEGEPVKMKKSKFVGYAGLASNGAEARRFVDAVKYRGKNVLNATHVISAWRLANGSQERDDDGEGGAGDKLLHLLDVLDAKNVVVVVVRWFGGILLGPDRFKLIAEAASLALKAKAQ